MTPLCTDPQHLSLNDQRWLKSLRIVPWPCPTCSAKEED